MARQKRILTEEEKTRILKAKQELKNYKHDIKYINEKIDDTEETRTILEKVTATWSPTKTNSSKDSPDKFADVISDVEDLKTECEDRLQALMLKKVSIDNKIDSMKYPYKTLLYLRYVRCKSWMEIASELDYSLRQVYNLHGDALYEYSKI